MAGKSITITKNAYSTLLEIQPTFPGCCCKPIFPLFTFSPSLIKKKEYRPYGHNEVISARL